MKQLIVITGVILLICVFTSAVIIPANAQQGSINDVVEAINNKEDNAYLLKSNNGVLCVYLKTNNELVMETDTNVKVLPKEDQKILEKGIEIKGDKALYQALEDYCS